MRHTATRIGKVAMAISILTLFTLTPALFASTDFTVPPGRSSDPIAMILGPDGNLWFVESSNQKIGYITTAGSITEFPIPNAQSLYGIAKGTDGNIWFTDQMAGFIGRISTGGTNLRTFALAAGSYPQGITAGPDGNLWFVEQRQNGFFRIGKITVGGQITEYQVGLNAGVYTALTLSPAQIAPGPDGNLWFTNPQLASVGIFAVGKITPSGIVTTYTTGDSPFAITAGPDGNLWAVESNHVAKITTSGTETEYQLTIAGSLGSITVGPDNNLWFTISNQVWTVTTAGVATKIGRLAPGFYYLLGITTGPDGALWFVGSGTSNVGRITTSGQVTSYPLNPGGQPVWITLGPDGNLWFTQFFADRVSRITPGGTVTTFSLTQYSRPNGIVSGSDGNLWFTEEGSSKIGQMSSAGVLLNEYAAGNGGLFYITSGADGNLWFSPNSPSPPRAPWG
jgi:streptogramin lyase